MWQDIGVGIGQRRARRGVISPVSAAAPATLVFADGDQPYNAAGISITDSTPAWLPADAVFFADFDNGLFYWDGATRTLGDLTDNGDGTYDVDLATALDMGNLSGFVEVTNSDTPVLNETCFGLFNSSNNARFEVVTSSGDELRIYDTGTLGFAISGFDDGGGSNSGWKRFRCAWSYSAGSPRLVFNGYSDTAVNGDAVSVPGMDRVGIGWRRWSSGPLFSGTVQKVCIIDAAKTDEELRELNRYERNQIGIHWLGDSFLNGGAIRDDFDDLVVARGQYFFTSTDQAGASSLTEQAARFAAKPRYWGQTLVIVDGGLTANDSSVAALQSIVGNLTHDRWLYVQSNPKETTGTGDRGNWDNEDAAILTFCGPEHYLETKSVMQANGDGGATDNADIANDIWPTSLRTDPAHPNSAGRAILGQLIYDRIVAEGWLAYTVKLSISDADLTVGATTSATIVENGTATVTISGNEADVNSELASLLINGAEEGSHSLTVSIYDPATGRSASRIVPITVTGFAFSTLAARQTAADQDVNTVVGLLP